MSKFAIVLCAVLFASAANTVISDTHPKTDLSLNNVERIINGDISTIIEIYNDCWKEADEIARNLNNTARRVIDQSRNRVEAAVNQVIEDLKSCDVDAYANEEPPPNVNSADIIPCDEYCRDLVKVPYAKYNAKKTCINEILNTTFRYIATFKQVSIHALVNLYNAGREVEKCRGNVQCATHAGMNTLEVRSQFVVHATTYLQGVRNLSETFEESYTSCTMGKILDDPSVGSFFDELTMICLDGD